MTSNYYHQRDEASRIKHPKPKGVLLECGQGTGGRTFTSSDEPPFQLAHVTLDTTSINKSKVLIKFSSLVNMTALASGATVRLQYELFRVCGSKEPESLGTWIFEEVGVSPVVFETQKESFSFIFCESTNCLECCEYFVTVNPIEIVEASVRVSDGRIAALAQSLCDYLEEVLLVCGQGNGSITFREATISQPPVRIAHVTVDTACLCKPEVLIEFSSIINLDFSVLDVGLKFELFRACGDEEPLSLGTWTFERTNTTLRTAVDKVFTFVFCDNVLCTGCCEYFVTVTGIELDVDPPGFFLGAAVNNARITAIAQASKTNYHFLPEKSDQDRNNSMSWCSDCSYCVPKSPKPKKILLECGMGTGERIFTSSSDSAFQLAQVTIDTTCLCKPIVNIEFSSIVSFERLQNTGRAELRYELFRVCGDRKPISLGIWTLSRINLITIDRSTNAFDFTFCDCITCPGCCDYFVTVTPIEITEGLITATVSNGRMSASAVEG